MARYRRSHQRELWAIVAILLIALLRWWCGGDGSQERNRFDDPALAPGVYEVDRVVDGDTLDLRQPHYRIRLQGVDTPETVRPDWPVEPWAPEASAFAKEFVDEARGRVRVEIDGETRDKYGRHLAFIWNGERMLNEELVRKGLARATLQYDFGIRKKDLLRDAERKAKKEHLGIWSK
jgi:micrococcal nuclease